MLPNVSMRRSGPSQVADFVDAATATGAIVRSVLGGGLPALLESYGLQSGAGSAGISSDLTRVLGIPESENSETHPLTWISRARLGIATTGSLLVAERRVEDRLRAFLCSKHVIVLPSNRIVMTHADAVDEIRSCLTRGIGYVTLVSGPSRTSDIEKVLTVGAHGPIELDVVLVDQWRPDDD